MGDKCMNCGAFATERAHVFPKSLGGVGTLPLCGPCHGLSHGMSRAQDIRLLTRLGLARADASRMERAARNPVVIDGADAANMEPIEFVHYANAASRREANLDIAEARRRRMWLGDYLDSKKAGAL